jgi:hypothetical protein
LAWRVDEKMKGIFEREVEECLMIELFETFECLEKLMV